MYNLEFRKQRIKKTKLFCFALASIIVILGVITISFIASILSKEEQSVKNYMSQSVQQTASNLNVRVLNSINEMKILALKLGNEVDIESEDKVSMFLKRHISDYDYQQLLFIYPDGRTVRYQKNVGKTSSINWINESKFFSAIQKSDAFTSTSQNDDVPSGYVNEFAVPVYDSNKNLVGVLGSLIYANSYLKVLGYNNYSENGYAYILNQNGDYVVKSPRDKSEFKNFFDMDIKYIDIKKEEVQRALKNKENISFLCSYNLKKYVITFSPLRNRTSTVMVAVPISVLMLHIDSLLIGIICSVSIIALLVFILFYYINISFNEEEKFIYNIAFADKITGGANKNKFILDAKSILNDWMSEHKANYALIAIDIATYKAIKELYGARRSNKILKDVYNILQNKISEKGICVRDYDSKFLVLLEYEKQEDIIKIFIEKVLAEINTYNENNMTQFFTESGTTISSKIAMYFGIYLVNDLSYTIDQMCENAYTANRSIKGSTQNSYKFYDDNFRIQRLQNKVIEDEMFEALKDHQFKMYLQPKYDFKTLKLVGAEALVRWVHPKKGIIKPENYISLFEQNGFILELDKCVWKQVCEFLSDRKKSFKNMFPISVNVSRIHMNDDLFVDELISMVKEYDIDPSYIELELTETACFDDSTRFKNIIEKLNKNGFTISIDDFGTGYSSLNMLREISVNILKFDSDFIKDTINDEKGQIIVRNIVNMAKELKISTVAEGIETEEQAEFLRNAGCDIAQGYLYGLPLEKEVFTEQVLKETDAEIFYKN